MNGANSAFSFLLIAGSAPDNGNTALTNEGFVNFLQCVLMSAHNDGRAVAPDQKPAGFPRFQGIEQTFLKGEVMGGVKGVYTQSQHWGNPYPREGGVRHCSSMTGDCRAPYPFRRSRKRASVGQGLRVTGGNRLPENPALHIISPERTSSMTDRQSQYRCFVCLSRYCCGYPG